MAAIVLEGEDVPAVRVLNGATVVTLAPPNKTRIQVVGPNAETLFDAGPATGKQWAVRVTVQITETDV